MILRSESYLIEIHINNSILETLNNLQNNIITVCPNSSFLNIADKLIC